MCNLPSKSWGPKLPTARSRLPFPRWLAAGCQGRACTLSGNLKAPPLISRDGTIRIEWLWRAPNGRYQKIHGGLKKANKPFAFRQRLKRGGRWRVRVRYLNKAPLRGTSSSYVSFTVR